MAPKADRAAADFPAEDLLARWRAASRDLGATDDQAIDLAWLILDALYHHPPRWYHTWSHIADCLAVSDSFAAAMPDGHGPAIRLAILLHDCVYDSRRDDNEHRSAEIARLLGGSMGLPSAAQDEVVRLVLATTHHGCPAGAAEAFIRDVDLASLAASRDEFDSNGRDIRREFAWATDQQWSDGRAAFFRRVLERPSVYLTPEFRAQFESAARENLTRALALISPPSAKETT